MEAGKLRVRRTTQGVREFRETSPGPFSMPGLDETEIALVAPSEHSHREVTQNFVNAILHDEPLIAPAIEGIKGLELGNAMLLSGLTRQPVELPLDAQRFDRFIDELAHQYAGRKIPAEGAAQPVQPRF
jgi:hypothetical protein